MAHLATRILGVLGAWALVVGCSAGAADPGLQGPPANSGSQAMAWPGYPAVVVDEQPPMWWDMSTQRRLTPTGIEILVAPGADTTRSGSNLAVEAMVVDGTGAVWIQAPWRLFRLDPRTGDASVWDVGDDLAFGTVSSLRPSASAGVWLLYEDHVALFDGRRFVRELVVPVAYRGDGPIRDLVEVDSEVWLSSSAGVIRCRSGAWSKVGGDRLLSAAALAVGGDGQVWTFGRIRSEEGPQLGMARFDGLLWHRADPPVSVNPKRQIVPDPAGGVAYMIGSSVYLFRSSSWQTLALPLPSTAFATELGISRSLAVTEDGRVWLLGHGGMARWEASLGWEAMGSDNGSVRWGQLPFQAMASSGNHVFIAGAQGLFRVDDHQVTPVWAPARIGPRTGWHPTTAAETHSDPAQERSFGEVSAVSSDEVWLASGSSVFRYLEGRWTSEWPTGPDGAAWVVEPSDVLGGPSVHEPGDDMTLAGPGESRAAVPLPVGVNAVAAVYSGADGSLFATMLPHSDGDHPSPSQELLRWDDRWNPVPYPGEDLVDLAVDAGGGLWALLTPVGAPDAGPVVARYAHGEWTLFTEAAGLGSLTLAPGGSVCGMDQEELSLVCVNPAGDVARQPLGVSGGLVIGADGSVWLTHAGMLARLPVSVPPGRAR